MSVESAERAQALLDALNCGDAQVLRHCLNRGPASESAFLTGVEYERRELLDGIVESLRAAMCHNYVGSTNADVQVSIELLRHLVTTH